MRIKAITVTNFKRFHNLTVTNIPSTAKLVVLTGPNGCGKSSLFDAMRVWHHQHAAGWGLSEDVYYHKTGTPPKDIRSAVDVKWHDPLPRETRDRRKMLYIRSAYRLDADFTVQDLRRMRDFVDDEQNQRLIDLDSKVQENYQRLASNTLQQVFMGAGDEQTVRSLRESVIASIRDPLLAVFPDLELTSLGDPLQNGTFFFNKGVSANFHYKNLSAGEKAALNLMLDLAVKSTGFDDTCFCIDEPELHLNSRVQGALLTQLFKMLKGQSQLWIASHSLGMMRRAVELSRSHPGEVCFIDFEEVRPDEQTVLMPAIVGRDLWKKILQVALDDMAALVAPEKVVLCEGQPASRGIANPEFDATIYRAIFSSHYPNLDFVSVGNSHDVSDKAHPVGRSFESVLGGVQVSRVRDRDDLSSAEVASLTASGVRILKRRHLESYLLDEEVLDALCRLVNRASDLPKVKTALATALRNSQSRNNPSDDYKSASGEFYNEVKKILNLTAKGSDSAAFMRDTLAPLIKPGMNIYAELEKEVIL